MLAIICSAGLNRIVFPGRTRSIVSNWEGRDQSPSHEEPTTSNSALGAPRGRMYSSVCETTHTLLEHSVHFLFLLLDSMHKSCFFSCCLLDTVVISCLTNWNLDVLKEENHKQTNFCNFLFAFCREEAVKQLKLIS